jgi:hypothetical protein
MSNAESEGLAVRSATLDFAGDTCLVFDQAGRLVGSMFLEQSRYANFGVTVCVCQWLHSGCPFCR